MSMKSLKDRVALACFEVLGSHVPLTSPSHAEFGDYCVNVMQLQPRPDQTQIDAYIRHFHTLELFEKIEQKGAYLNFFIHATILQGYLADSLQRADYGDSEKGKGKTWAIEHTSPNPNKAMHLGHLRNNVLSMALVRLWEKAGISVVCDAVDNNRGIAIARLMWGFLHFARKKDTTDTSIAYWHSHQKEWHTPHSLNVSPGKFVDSLYVQASTVYEADDNVREEIRAMVVAWEQEDELVRALWKHVLAYSYEGQKATLERLGNRWDMIWHEHEHYQRGKSYVQEGLDKGVFIRTSEGTIITQLESYNLPDTVVLKSDDTSLYLTQDIALTDLKRQKHNADKLIWVIGPEQSLALKQLFAVCEQLGIGSQDSFEHISYGWMSLKGQGTMSSRKGNVIYIDDLIDDAHEKAVKEIRHPELLLEPLESVAEKVGLGAIKYSLLRVGRTQDIAFDMEESVRFDGNSGPYIQYAYARLQSIVRKAGDSMNPTSSHSLSNSERALLMKIAQYEDVVVESAFSNAPHELALYVYQLTQACNVLYETEPILQAGQDTKLFRLSLIRSACFIIKDGLGILGIEVVEAM